MLASLAGPRVARSLVPVQAAAANTTHARPTTACGGNAHALPVASMVSLQTLGTSALPLIRPSPASAGDLAPAAAGATRRGSGHSYWARLSIYQNLSASAIEAIAAATSTSPVSSRLARPPTSPSRSAPHRMVLDGVREVRDATV